ncbi:2-hydroxychromene-2-carboxylate isomerase [Achromobacter deleyi]|uniref:2-hydroxychromene-2-carboxylate isomerase n=1 Tax=Achromobacter TaxID=222 RepID=UPI002860D9C7|nr:2-hydroxychromene-2-carboxylate isomerase [Achromobacter deleyi]MDR6603277.1 2-hydroxychromene-2-carboxylate isomerase [Achromobacter deleyi]
MKTIDYYFWMNSDWAYLGADRLEALAARQQAVIRYLPVDLPDVYSRTGGVLLGQRSPERQAYRVAELARWCRKLGIHVNPRPAHMCPDAGLASRIVIAADLAGTPVPALYKAILKAQWVDEQDISDPAVLRGVLERLGLPADRLLTAAQAPAIDAAYRRNTDDAVKAGVFGSPSYVFRGEVFWGQDRLDMLEETLAPSPLTSSPAGRSTSTGA